jgi:hypothetical protein
MPEQSQWFDDHLAPRLLGQLQEKTQQGKLSWSTGFEDGQFKTLLPGGKFAFIVQVKGNVRKFMMLDDHQETILREEVTHDQTLEEPILSSKEQVYDAIGKLQELVRSRALQVNEKLQKAEKLLADI